MGMSGSGKTHFSKILNKIIPNSTHLNADEIRAKYNDWDFSIEGRIRQAERMVNLANLYDGIVIIDMICPLKEMRNIIQPDFICYIHTKNRGKYADTADIFQPPDEKESPFFYKILSYNDENV